MAGWKSELIGVHTASQSSACGGTGTGTGNTLEANPRGDLVSHNGRRSLKLKYDVAYSRILQAHSSG